MTREIVVVTDTTGRATEVYAVVDGERRELPFPVQRVETVWDATERRSTKVTFRANLRTEQLEET